MGKALDASDGLNEALNGASSAGGGDEAAVPDYKVIDDLATLRVLSDPLRLRLIELLGVQPATVKTLAKALGVKPNRLYYHVNLLEEHGLVRVTASRMVSGIVERTYGLVARHIAVDDNLAMPAELRRAMTDTILSVVGAELEQALRLDEAGRPPTAVGRMQLFLRPDERVGFEKKLSELLEEYGTGSRERADDAVRHVLLFALYSPAGDSAAADSEREG